LTRWRIGLAATALVAIAAGFGCGGSDGDSSSGPSPSADYVTRATAICNKAAERREKGLQRAIDERGQSEAESDAIELATEVLAPIYRDMVKELSALELPTGKKGREYEAWVEKFEELLQRSEADHSWFLRPYVGPHRKARRAGLRACAAI
jgi:hypothetical protein